MTNCWRPKKDWSVLLGEQLTLKYRDDMTIGEVAEIGADAMLKAIRHNGCVSSESLRNSGGFGWIYPQDGFWYFIPEEDNEKDTVKETK